MGGPVCVCVRGWACVCVSVCMCVCVFCEDIQVCLLIAGVSPCPQIKMTSW